MELDYSVILSLFLSYILKMQFMCLYNTLLDFPIIFNIKLEL